MAAASCLTRWLSPHSQLMFLIGITLTIGTSHVMSFFLARKKLRGTCTFFVGMALVMYGWPVVGILVEGFGFMNLFWNFFPIAMSFLSRATPAALWQKAVRMTQHQQDRKPTRYGQKRC
eukprot:COSAG02_NODE_35383_length_469_cov_0.870270_1_plen_118_part_01